MDFSDEIMTSVPGLSLPYSNEAEQAVLGIILFDPQSLATVAELLPRDEYFAGTNNKRIYAAMLELFTLGQQVDFITVLNFLEKTNSFNLETGKIYLTQLAQSVPSIKNVEIYINIIKEKYNLRRLIIAAREILDDALDPSNEVNNLINSAEQRIFDIRQGKSVSGLTRINDVLTETWEKLDVLNSDEADMYRGIPTGIGELDNTITGLNRSDLIILAARPGMGKTSFALNIARHAAVTCKKRVCFFSLEM